MYFFGIAVAAVGLAVFRGFRPIPWLIVGALVTRYGGDALRFLGDWNVGDVNLRFIPRARSAPRRGSHLRAIAKRSDPPALAIRSHPS
jgi:hypothetical protein